MIFKIHSAFALGLIALCAGTYLVSKVSSENKCSRGFAKLVGWLVVLTALLGLVCTGYHGFTYMKAGGFGKMGYGMHMMKKCPMMEKMMMEKQEPAKTE